MRTILLSMTCEDGVYGFDARVPADLADKLMVAQRAGAKPVIDGVLICRQPDWTVGTPLGPVYRFFSALWNS